MDSKIFILDKHQKIISLEQHAYDSEDLLQRLLANHPELLAADQIGSSPRRWLLVSRETPVPDQETELTGRWSLDHLFLDQDGIPTLIEVKRSTDSRIRREVVGQMLDYAANAVSYWKIDEIRARFEAALGSEDVGQIFEDQLGIASPEVFWQVVETNLRAGKIRMIFVADEIPNELRRIVEFLNEQMTPAEVLAIAIRQYVGEDLKTLVPTLYGQTAKSQGTKSRRDSNKWTEETYFTELQSNKSPQEVEVASKILQWARSRNLVIWWGEGKSLGSFIPMLYVNGHKNFSIAVWTNGSIEMQFQHMQSRPPFDDEALREQLRQKLNAIESVNLPDDSLYRRPSFPLSALVDAADFEMFVSTLDWFIELVRSHHIIK